MLLLYFAIVLYGPNTQQQQKTYYNYTYYEIYFTPQMFPKATRLPSCRSYY